MEFDVRYAVLEACGGVRIFGRGFAKRGVRTNPRTPSGYGPALTTLLSCIKTQITNGMY